MSWFRFIFLLTFFLYGSQSLGDALDAQDLLNAAIQEMEKDESFITERESKRKLAEKARRQVAKQKGSSEPELSSSKQNYDFGDVVVTISERELEDIPETYLPEEDEDTSVLSVKKKPKRQTSSIKLQTPPQREPSSEE